MVLFLRWPYFWVVLFLGWSYIWDGLVSGVLSFLEWTFSGSVLLYSESTGISLLLQMFGRTLKCSIAKDNGRAADYIRRKVYKDKSRCYECGVSNFKKHCWLHAQSTTSCNKAAKPKYALTPPSTQGSKLTY